MKYVKQSDNSVVSVHDIRRENPNISIPEAADCSHLGYEFLTEVAPPQLLPWHKLVEGAPVNNTQVWTQQQIPTVEIIRTCELEVQKRLDSFAKLRNYDSMLSACTYANSSNPTFKAESVICADFRDATWSKCYEILNDVTNEVRPLMTLEQLINELPILTWPL